MNYPPIEVSGDIRPLHFYDSKDSFGWYLFLAEALLDHIGNYDYVYGSRVTPLFQAIGHDLDLLLKVEGVEARVRRMVTKERGQPNGGIFELLVAAAYLRAGAEVAFVKEKPGQGKTHDMDVILNGQTWAIECKRMEIGEYGERERLQVGRLWDASSSPLAQIERNTFCQVRFNVEMKAVPAEYLHEKVKQWLASGKIALAWGDAISSGSIRKLDLRPLQCVLSKDFVLGSSHRILELLTGRYIRNANYRTLLMMRPGDNPRYVDDCDLAVILQWDSASDTAIDEKARDIRKKLSEATQQLPEERPSIVHIGFEAIEGDHVERRRYEKILTTARKFDPGQKCLEYVCCHYFVPESPPDECWAFDETNHWCSIRPEHAIPIEGIFLVLAEASKKGSGPHWKE